MIRLEGIEKSFGTNRVLAGLDMHVARGESLVVIGGSGSGKSVLIKCVLGLIRHDAGRVLVEGAELTREGRAAFLGRCGVLFQGGALFDSLPVWQNVAFRFLRGPRALPRTEARALAIARLERVGLGEDVADRLPAELSGGMQKRVGLARATAADPQLIFFDEPTAGLDPIMSGVINDLIRSIVTETGSTAITITHDMRSVRRIADRVALLHEGVIRWTGSVAEMEETSDPYVSQFIHGRAEGPIRTLR